MNKISKLMLSLLLLTPIYGAVYAANHEANHESHEVKPVVTSENKDDKYTPSVIKKIDKENGKITLKHEEIKNLEMPGMTMVFKLKLVDMNVVDTLKVGDNVKIFFDKSNEGFIVKEIVKN